MSREVWRQQSVRMPGKRCGLRESDYERYMKRLSERDGECRRESYERLRMNPFVFHISSSPEFPDWTPEVQPQAHTLSGYQRP
jgi:hypothetical protein